MLFLFVYSTKAARLKSNMKQYPILFLFLLSLTISFAQNQRDKQAIAVIDGLITDRLAKIAPGCAVLVAKNGKILYKKAHGTADLETKTPVEPDMSFRIGSITNQFTAVAILQLVEKGKLSLTDQVNRFVQGFAPNHPVTIQHLLSQTSGIPDYMDLETHVANPYERDIPSKVVIDSIKNQPLDFAPGTKFAYSNSNYFLLGYIIEQVTGNSYQDYLYRNIFKPLRLKNTGYDHPQVKGYEKINSGYYKVAPLSMSLFYSTGGLVSCVQDMYTWNEALRSNKLAKKTTIAKAFQSVPLSDGKASEYGFGWFLRNIEGSKTIEHGGTVFGFRSEQLYLPKEDIYIVALLNGRQLNNDEQELCYEIARVLLNKTPITKGTR